MTLVSMCAQTADVLAGDKRTGLRMQDTLSAKVAGIHMVRSARLMASIGRLCDSGFAAESGTLIRCLLEDAVSLAYMSLEPEMRAREWIAHGDDLSYMSLCRARELGHDIPDDDRTRELDATFAGKKPRLWWSGKAPSQMAAAIHDAWPQIHEDFVSSYGILSVDVHGNSKSGERYAVDVGGIVHFVVAPSNDQVGERVAEAVHLSKGLSEVAVALGVSVDTAALDRICSAVALLYLLAAQNASAPTASLGAAPQGETVPDET